MSEINTKTVNSLTLAYLGDAEYELFVRMRLISLHPNAHAHDLHRYAVGYVCAAAQAHIIKVFLEENFLTDEELAVVKRGRNHKTATKAKNADPIDYKWATAFEALIGYLYLSEQKERIQEIMEATL